MTHVGRVGKNPGLNQGVEPRLRQVEHLSHFHDGNNCFSGFFLGGHWATLGLFQDCLETQSGRRHDRYWSILHRIGTHRAPLWYV